VAPPAAHIDGYVFVRVVVHNFPQGDGEPNTVIVKVEPCPLGRLPAPVALPLSGRWTVDKI